MYDEDEDDVIVLFMFSIFFWSIIKESMTKSKERENTK